MRNMWIQREVIEIGKILGFKNWDRRAVKYWVDHGIFPKPVAKLEGMVVWYPNKGLNTAFVDISKRQYGLQRAIDDSDVEKAKKKVLEQNKAKNVSTMMAIIRERKGLSYCKECGEEDVRVNDKGFCFNCNNNKLFKIKKK